jgi:hypothetical protein
MADREGDRIERERCTGREGGMGGEREIEMEIEM